MSSIDGNPAFWNSPPSASGRRKSKHEERDHYRAPLNIPTPTVADEELRKRWHGAPPSRPKLEPRQGGPVVF